MDSVIEACLLEKKATIHSRIQRFGPQTTSSICRGITSEWTEADFPKVQAELERLAEQLGIVEGINGWVLDIGALIMKDALRIQTAISRSGPLTTQCIAETILGLNKSEVPQVQANLQRLADQLGIAQGEKGWVPDTSILAPEANRRYTYESHRIQVAREQAYDMGLSGIYKINKDGNPEPVWADLTRRVSRITEEDVPRSWFAPSGHGAQFREYLEAALADGLAEREKRIDAVASELGGIVEKVTSATNGNGNGHHIEDDGPTEEDLTLIQEIAKLEADAEEYQDRIKALEAQLAAMAWVSGDVEQYQNKIAALEAQLAAPAPAQVQTPQPDTGGTLEGILAALETQLEAASLKAEAAAKAVEAAQEQAELAELEVDQARQRLQAAMEAVQTLQSLKEGE
jgi:hypothetical protein